MEYKLEFREAAQKDLFRAYKFYEKQQIGLGEKFISEVEFGLKFVKRNPEAFPEKKKGFREFILKTFPYILIYRLDKQEVTIFAIFHTSLNPSKKP